MREAIACALALGAVALCGCGDTLQDQPIGPAQLEQLITVDQFPVYWLGGRFQKMAITNVVRDPSGAFSVSYGDCVSGGQSTCVPPLAIVTSPDNSFLAAGWAPQRRLIRGVPMFFAQNGSTVVFATGSVVVDIYARSAKVALAAAQRAVAINQGGTPGEPLPRPLPDSGFTSQPLTVQLPSPTAQSQED